MLGTDATIGLDIDCMNIDANMLMLVTSGMAVRLQVIQ